VEDRIAKDIHHAKLLVKFAREYSREITSTSMLKVTDDAAVVDVLRTGGRLPCIPELDHNY
jgi:hypothetical protein